jgi:HEAT repeat protein
MQGDLRRLRRVMATEIVQYWQPVTIMKRHKPYFDWRTVDGTLRRVRVVMCLCALLAALSGCSRSGTSEFHAYDLPTALSKLRSGDLRERREAEARLSDFRFSSPSVVLSEYLKLIHDPDKDIRWSACSGLGHMEGRAASAKGELAATLRDSDAAVRFAAACALGEIGDLSRAEVRALAGILSDPDRAVRMAAEEAIAKAGRKGVAALPELEQTLHDSDGSIVSGAAEAIGNAGVASESIVDELIRLVDDPSRGAQASAAWALGSVGAIAKKAVPSLQAALGSHEPIVRASAARSIWKLTGNTKDTIPVLEGCVNVVIPAHEGTDCVYKESTDWPAHNAASEAFREIEQNER